MCACTEPDKTGIGAVCVEYGRPKWPITMLNHTHKCLVQKNVVFFIFGTLCSYDPLWRGFFFLWKPRKKGLASLARLMIICTISRQRFQLYDLFRFVCSSFICFLLISSERFQLDDLIHCVSSSYICFPPELFRSRVSYWRATAVCPVTTDCNCSDELMWEQQLEWPAIQDGHHL